MKRRDALKAIAVILAVPVAKAYAPIRWARAAARVRRWSGHVVLPNGYTVKAGHVVEFDPERTTTVESSGNIVVNGTLRMRPGSSDVTHTLRFVDVDEEGFVGGGMDPLPSDVGLWVIDSGCLDAGGSEKVAWTRSRSIAAGARELHLTHAPTGWRKGDDVAITPTLAPTDSHYTTSEVRRIRSVNGLTIVLSAPVTFAHPSVSGPLGDFGPEILNLTRNVRIEGTPTGRSHVFLRPSGPQSFSNVAVRYMGPRKGDSSILGRYGVHFHMAQDSTRGSVLTGVVVRDCASHAFVPHFSHGITFRGCISFSTVNDAYWWDQVPGNLAGSDSSDNYPETISNDIVYDRCVAADVSGLNSDETYRLCGFALNRGTGQQAIGCVAVGIRQGKQNSGFQWPENNYGGWLVHDCVGHNNSQSGLFIWQNGKDDVSSSVQRFVAYHNRQGMYHGAYNNHDSFEDCWCYGNIVAGVLLAAQSPPSVPGRYTRCTVDGAGLADYAMRTNPHNYSGGSSTIFEECRFSGARVACVGIINSNREFDLETFNDCTYQGNEFWFGDSLDASTLVGVNDHQHGHLTLRPKGQPGSYDSDWNASVTAGSAPAGTPA